VRGATAKIAEGGAACIEIRPTARPAVLAASAFNRREDERAGR